MELERTARKGNEKKGIVKEMEGKCKKGNGQTVSVKEMERILILTVPVLLV